MSDPSAVTESSKMSDLLSAASLLLTVLGVVYGTWYSEIINTLGKQIDVHPQNRGPIRETVRATLYSKALPLAVAAIALTIVFLPDAVTIVLTGVNAVRAGGTNAFHQYDAVEAAFCLVVLLAGALSGYLIALVCQLRGKLKKINTV